MSTPNYHMDKSKNESMAAFEKVLWQFEGKKLAACFKLSESDQKEILSICDEGVASFEAASAGVAPLQRVIVGVQFTLNALKEWREKGPC